MPEEVAQGGGMTNPAVASGRGGRPFGAADRRVGRAPRRNTVGGRGVVDDVSRCIAIREIQNAQDCR